MLPTLVFPAALRLARPDAEAVRRAREAGRDAPLSYPHVGASEGPFPPGWDTDVQEEAVGQGPEDFARARRAIESWRTFALDWVDLHDPTVPIRVGELVTFASRQLGLWTLNVCRIVRVVDEPLAFGFAYGTLDGHVVAGEERFVARLEPTTGRVLYGLRKFSRPNHPLVRAFAPLARRVQHRFGEDSIAAVRRAVSERT